jgi:hypothetical protein
MMLNMAYIKRHQTPPLSRNYINKAPMNNIENELSPEEERFLERQEVMHWTILDARELNKNEYLKKMHEPPLIHNVAFVKRKDKSGHRLRDNLGKCPICFPDNLTNLLDKKHEESAKKNKLQQEQAYKNGQARAKQEDGSKYVFLIAVPIATFLNYEFISSNVLFIGVLISLVLGLLGAILSLQVSTFEYLPDNSVLFGIFSLATIASTVYNLFFSLGLIITFLISSLAG